MKNKIKNIIIVILVLIIGYQFNVVFNGTDIDYNENDMQAIKNIVIGKTNATKIDYIIYDLNNDGIIDGFDIMIIKRHCLGIKSLKRRVI